LVRAGGPDLGARRTDVDVIADAVARSWLVKASGGLRSGEGSRWTWLRSSISRGGGSPRSGALGIPSSRR